MKYKVLLKKSDEGVAVSCPGLPGCWSEGRTEEEALRNIEDAIREYLLVREDLMRDGEVREVEIGGRRAEDPPVSTTGTPFAHSKKLVSASPAKESMSS
jgi:predicted RNase H-like HicB family nuclease